MLLYRMSSRKCRDDRIYCSGRWRIWTTDIEGLIKAQARDECCEHIRQLTEKPGTSFSIDQNLMIVRIASIHGSIQCLVTLRLPQTVLNSVCYPWLAGYPRDRGMFGTIGKEGYWSHMVTDVHKAIKNCKGYTRMGTKFKNHEHCSPS